MITTGNGGVPLGILITPTKGIPSELVKKQVEEAQKHIVLAIKEYERLAQEAEKS